MRSKNKHEFQAIRKEVSVEEFVTDFYNPTMEKLVNVTNSLSLYDNTDSFLIENLKVPSGGRKRVSHSLKVVPQFRILVRQKSGGVILDGVWTDKMVEFINNDPSDFEGTILLLKG